MEDLQLIANDIAQAVERKQAEEALRRSEARNRALVEALPDLIFRLDRRGVFLDYNAPQEVLARPPAEFLGRHVGELLPPTLAGEAQRALERALSTGKMQNFEYRLSDSLGLRDFEARFVPLGDEEALVIVRDITEGKRLEREILEVSGREQRRIGQDLHDGLCQQLSGIALMSRALEKSLAEKSLPESETAARITALVLHSMDQTRSLARGLYPVELERSGIVAALRDLAEQTQGLFAIPCDFHYDAPVEINDRVTALHLYLIAQEAVGNAAKHARARQIVVTLAQDRDTLRLTVSDDGRGMPRELERGQGMGLSIMNYRARIIDATLDIQPRAEGGTVVTCTLRNPNP
jgi:PAS domain S-box-containing protein